MNRFSFISFYRKQFERRKISDYLENVWSDAKTQGFLLLEMDGSGRERGSAKRIEVAVRKLRKKLSVFFFLI